MVNRSRPQALALLNYDNLMKHSQLQLLTTKGLTPHSSIARKHLLRYRTSVWLPRNFALSNSVKTLRQSPGLRGGAVFQATLGSAFKLTILSNKPDSLTRTQLWGRLPLALYYRLSNYALFNKAVFSKLLLTLTFLNSFPLRPVRGWKRGAHHYNPLLAYFTKRYL